MKYALLLKVNADKSKRTVFMLATDEDAALDEASMYLTMIFTKDIDAVQSARVVEFEADTHDRAGLKQAAKTKKYRIASFDIEDIRRTLKEG